MTDTLAFLAGGGEATRMIRDRDWTGHPLGPPEGWAPEFKAALSLVLNSPESMILAWGPDLSFFFNETYFPLLGPRLPWAMGERFDKVWADGWEQAKPIIVAAFAGKSERFIDLPWKLGTDRGARDTWWTFSYSRVLDGNGNVAGLFIFTNETSDRVLGDAALRESEERLRLVVEGAKDHAILTTDPAGIITSWSAGAQAALGWSFHEAIGKSASILFTPEDRVAGVDGRELVTAARNGCANDERWHLTKDGRRVFMNGSVHPLPVDAQGHGRGFIKIARDETQRRAVDVALREARGLNTPLLENSRDCSVVLDLEGNNQWVSPGGIASMEIDDVDAILGLSWLRVWKDDDYVAASAAIAKARSGDIGRFQGFCPTHKGTSKWWDVVVSPLPGPDGRPQRLISVGRDITEQKHAAFALKTLNENLEARVAERTAERDQIWQTSIDLICVGTFDGYFVELNPSWTRTLGWSEAELKDAPFISFVHPDDAERTLAAMAALKEGDSVSQFENRYRHKDGDWRWLSWNAVPRDGKIYSVVRDITEQRALTRERERTWEISPVLKMIVSKDGTLLSINPGFTKALGWQSEEVQGRPVAELLAPEDRATSQARREKLVAGEHLPEYDVGLLTKGGVQRRVLWTTLVEDDNIYAFGRDVTVEREQAEALAKSEDALRQSQKMEAVGQLTGGLAHDFNNLLAGITGSLELLNVRIAQGRVNEIERYIMAAQGAAKRAAALTHRLLAFSRRQTLDPKPTNVNKLVAGMEDLIRRSVGPSIDVQVVGASGLWAVLADPPQLENALLNLCINARDAMPDGGNLTIETANRWLDGKAALEREIPPGQYVSMCVSDSGTGMTADVIAKAFDPFFTTKPIGQGTGLGLSMIYGFARQSGGQVRIYSEVGQGTMVCLYLPRHQGAEEKADATPELADAPRAQQGETVLVVDDEPTVRMLVTEVLEDLGYAAIEAADGPSGIQVLQSNARIDLLITDVGLPGGMNGRQVADAARITRPNLKVLFITGYAENAVVGHGHLERGMHVMTKPFALEALASRIKELISG